MLLYAKLLKGRGNAPGIEAEILFSHCRKKIAADSPVFSQRKKGAHMMITI
jgi:hypothetical protein